MAGADMEGWFFQSYRAFQERPVDDGIDQCLRSAL